MTVGEPLPAPGNDDRLLRTGLLAQALWDRDHEVVWWTSTLDSFTGQQRYRRDTQIRSKTGYEITLLRSVGYRGHSSARRVLEHEGVARRFRSHARRRPPPDIVVASYPTLELCREAVRLGRQHEIPVILDVRDLWPHVILDRVGRPMRQAVRLALAPMFRLATKLSAEATAITAVSPEAMNWFLNLSNRAQTPLDLSFPPGYSANPPEPETIDAARNFWRHKNVYPDGHTLIVTFVGSFTRNFEFQTVIEAARLLQRREVPIRFVLCGVGPLLEAWRDQTRDLSNVLFPGWVNSGQIWTLLRMSSVGLACYIDNQNFRHVLPNKPIEYLSAGLPVLSSTRGALERILTEDECGMTYDGRNPEELCRVLEGLIARPSVRDQMSANATHAFMQKFSADRVYGDMVDHLTHVHETYRSRSDRRGFPGRNR